MPLVDAVHKLGVAKASRLWGRRCHSDRIALFRQMDTRGVEINLCASSKATLLTLFSKYPKLVLVFGRPCRRSTTPGRQRIPFGPSHPALFIPDFNKNKGSIILAGF